jgi:hypothetical protein
MPQLLAHQFSDLLTEPAQRLACEAQLRVAAGTLSRTAADQVTAATAVGALGADDVPAFEELVHEIADEFGLEARVRLNAGSFSVRFSRRSTEATD